jgi:hypothetical protein
MRNQIASLKRANKAASARKQQKKKRLQHQGVLTKRASKDILTQRKANKKRTRKKRQREEQSGVSRQALARCKKCRETGHNSHTCRKETVATS